MQVGTFR